MVPTHYFFTWLGILMHGPPGCAKTTLARAAAGASGIAFFSLTPADVYASSFVGEAEAVVRRAFTLARSAAPCILFFDEIDSILGCGGDGSGHGMGRSSKSAEARVLSTFLNEMDGVDASQDDGVLVLGATNRPSTLDAALLRPGRFDNIIYVPPPDVEGRRALLERQWRGWGSKTSPSDNDTGAADVDIDLLASDAVTGSMTGAELLGACREAAMRAMRDCLESGESQNVPRMQQVYLEEAFRNVKPLLSNKHVLQEYTRFETQRTAS
jgi:SpoVK/Ycf46/Vps4 family AAA+-type ATPase